SRKVHGEIASVLNTTNLAEETDTGSVFVLEEHPAVRLGGLAFEPQPQFVDELVLKCSGDVNLFGTVSITGKQLEAQVIDDVDLSQATKLVVGRGQHVAEGRQVVAVNPTHEQTAERSGGSHFNIVVGELLRPI